MLGCRDATASSCGRYALLDRAEMFPRDFIFSKRLPNGRVTKMKRQLFGDLVSEMRRSIGVISHHLIEPTLAEKFSDEGSFEESTSSSSNKRGALGAITGGVLSSSNGSKRSSREEATIGNLGPAIEQLHDTLLSTGGLGALEARESLIKRESTTRIFSRTSTSRASLVRSHRDTNRIAPAAAEVLADPPTGVVPVIVSPSHEHSRRPAPTITPVEPVDGSAEEEKGAEESEPEEDVRDWLQRSASKKEKELFLLEHAELTPPPPPRA